MKLAVIGVNHKTAPISLRERLSFGSDLPQAVADIRALNESVSGAVIVSTCNRSEIYVGFDDNQQISDDGEGNLPSDVSKEVGGVSREFDWLTQQIFAAARTVRRDSKVGQQAVTLGFATAKLVTQIFDKPQNTTLLMVAAGEMNRLVAHNVASLGMTNIIIANRSPERAETLADELTTMAHDAGRTVHVRCVGLDELAQVLTEADVVSSCSGSMNALITHQMIKNAQKIRP